MKKPEYIDKGAVFSRDRKYRYMLWRKWRTPKPEKSLVLAMLNPSKANALKDDHTISKSVVFAYLLGYGGLVVVNAFALCATEPKDLLRYKGDRVGPSNYRWLQKACAGNEVIVGWGRWGLNKHLRGFVLYAREVIADAKPVFVGCLGRTKDGEPAHPLMLPYSAQLREYEL